MPTSKKSKAPPAPNEINETSASLAKTVQAISASPGDAVKLPVTARLENGFEYHLDLVRSVVDGILDPDVADVFIEIPCSIPNTRRFLHTSMIKEIDVRGLE